MPLANDQFVSLLAASGWHQARAARELGLTTATVSRYVSGKQTPSLPVLKLFASILGSSLTIYGGDGDPAAPMRDGPRWLSDWEENVLNQLRRLEPENRQRVVHCISELIDCMRPPVSYRSQQRLNAPATANDIAEGMASELIATRTNPAPDQPPAAAAPAPAPGVDARSSARRRSRGSTTS